jgi:hypothetical protein
VLGFSAPGSCALPLPLSGATLIKLLWISNAAGLRHPHVITVRALRICISMIKLRWTWPFRSHRSPPRNSVVRNALRRSQHQRRRPPRFHPRLRSRGEDAKVHATGPVPRALACWTSSLPQASPAHASTVPLPWRVVMMPGPCSASHSYCQNETRRDRASHRYSRMI